jgi:Family of unknown function (DUF6492)
MIQDIVTVAHLSDLNQLTFQAHSIDLFVTDPITHWVVVQDQSNLKMWQTAWAPFYRRHSLQILPTLLPDSHYNRKDRHGYRRQQLLKLMASQLVSNERYMVLDSKNFFWRQQSLLDWPCLDGRPIITDVDATGPRQPWVDTVADYLGLKSIQHTYEVLTPFVMTTKIAKKCCEYDMDFLFNEMSRPSDYWEAEQTFYSLIAHNFFDKITADDLVGQPDLTQSGTYFLTVSDMNISQLDRWLSVPSCLVSAIHRCVVAELTPNQRELLIEWFVSKGFDRAVASQSLEQTHAGEANFADLYGNPQ